MADPVTISMAATLAAGAVGAGGSLFGGAASKAAANYQAGIAQMNANIAQQNAATELGIGEAKAQQAGFAGGYKIAETKAIQAASGGNVNLGTNVAVRDTERGMTNLDQATIRSNAARKSWGFQVEAAGDEANAALDRMKGTTAQTAGEFGAGSSILGSIGTVAGQWAKASQTGPWKGPSFDISGWGDMFGFGKDKSTGWDTSGDDR